MPEFGNGDDSGNLLALALIFAVIIVLAYYFAGGK